MTASINVHARDRHARWPVAAWLATAFVLSLGDSAQAVVNGLETQRLPAVVAVSNSEGSLCSAVWVGDNPPTMLTAAHCIDGSESGGLQLNSTIGGYVGQPIGVASIKVWSRERLVDEPSNPSTAENFAYDLAVAVFPDGLDPHWLPVSRAPATAGEEVTIVGFGDNNIQLSLGAGVKRIGTNRIVKLDNGLILLEGRPSNLRTESLRGQNAIAGKGDSGGPLLSQFDTVLGIVSFGVTDYRSAIDGYVDVHSADSQALLDTARHEGADIRIAPADHGEILVAQDFDSIHAAAEDGATDAIRAMVASGEFIDQSDKSGRTGLHIAAINGQVDAIRTLLSLGAEPNAIDDHGQTALHLARDGQTVEALIRSGADVESRDDDGQTPLHIAVASGRAGVAHALLSAGADVNSVNSWGATPLVVSVISESPDRDVVRLLLLRGANPRIRVSVDNSLTGSVICKSGGQCLVGSSKLTQYSALDFARQSGEDKVVNLLVRFGADD